MRSGESKLTAWPPSQYMAELALSPSPVVIAARLATTVCAVLVSRVPVRIHQCRARDEFLLRRWYSGFIIAIVFGRSLASCALWLALAWRRLYSVKCRALWVASPYTVFSVADRSKASNAGTPLLRLPTCSRNLSQVKAAWPPDQLIQLFFVR